MKISLHWLRDYVKVKIPTDQLVHRLTMAGLEVEKALSAGSDKIFELEITPNRPDCLSLLGVARELSAILDQPRSFPTIPKIFRPKKRCPVTVEDAKACPRYVGTFIENVSIHAISKAMAGRLASLGMRPVNNVVDITNFCLMETGQPLHAFDFDKLKGGEIIVRRAKGGERIITIDGIERELDPSILVIADSERPVAVAGVMGGKDTEVTQQTKNILLESAYFDPLVVRRAARKLGLSTDSSYRFERGVDPGGVEPGADRAVHLILQQAGGMVTRRGEFINKTSIRRMKTIRVTCEEFNAFLGLNKTAAAYKKILKGLDFHVVESSKGRFVVTPPTFRADISAAVDLMEEVARIVGYDNIPLSFPKVSPVNIVSHQQRAVRGRVSELVRAQGLDEAVTLTMINRKSLERSGQAALPAVAIVNPLSQDQEILRPSMLPSLLPLVLTNANRGQKDVRFFELGKIYSTDGEKEVLGVIMTGERREDWRVLSKGEADYFDLKGVLEEVFARVGIPREQIRTPASESDFLEPGETAQIVWAGQKIGIAGKIREEILRAWDIKQKNVYFAEIEMGPVYDKGLPLNKYEPIIGVPSVARDISLAVGRQVPAQDIMDSIRATVQTQEGVALAAIKFLELYEGEKIPDGQRGLVFSLTYQSKASKTLTDEEIVRAHDKVCATLKQKFSVSLR